MFVHDCMGIVFNGPVLNGHLFSFASNVKQFSALSMYWNLLLLSTVGYIKMFLVGGDDI